MFSNCVLQNTIATANRMPPITPRTAKKPNLFNDMVTSVKCQSSQRHASRSGSAKKCCVVLIKSTNTLARPLLDTAVRLFWRQATEVSSCIATTKSGGSGSFGKRYFGKCLFLWKESSGKPGILKKLPPPTDPVICYK